jgi:hypothetical protein
VRGIGLVPTTAPSCALGVIGFMNAALGWRLPAFLAAFFAPPFFADDFFAADFEDDFLAALFFLVAIASPGWVLIGRPIFHSDALTRHASKV